MGSIVLRSCRRGVVLPQAALGLIALIGVASLALDIALVCVRKQMHVNGCDAAAMAGAAELPDRTAAEGAARQVATANGLAGRVSVSVSFPEPGVIVVESQEEMPVGLARIFGIATRTVRARARAALQVANEVRDGYPGGLRPWAVDNSQSFNFG